VAACICRKLLVLILSQSHSIFRALYPLFLNMSKYTKAFTTFPKELFRLNNGPKIRLRAFPGPLRPDRSFDLLTEAGKVKPKALSPETYDG
jgi:hypothetical protein